MMWRIFGTHIGRLDGIATASAAAAADMASVIRFEMPSWKASDSGAAELEART